MKKILLIILTLFALCFQDVEAQADEDIDSVEMREMLDSYNRFSKQCDEAFIARVGIERAKLIRDSVAQLRRIKPLICIVDTTTLPNPFVVSEQYRHFVFDSIPDKLSRRNMDKVLKDNDWYVLCGSDVYDYNAYDYLNLYGDLFIFVEGCKMTLNWDKKNRWWVGRFDDPNQLFLVILINVELLNSVHYDIDWISEEYDYRKAKQDYPSYNPQASYVKMLLPIRRGKGLPL